MENTMSDEAIREFCGAPRGTQVVRIESAEPVIGGPVVVGGHTRWANGDLIRADGSPTPMRVEVTTGWLRERVTARSRSPLADQDARLRDARRELAALAPPSTETV